MILINPVCFLFFIVKFYVNMKQILCKYKTNFVCINIASRNLFCLAEHDLKCERKEVTKCYDKLLMLIEKYDQVVSVINSRLERHSTRSPSLCEFY